MTDVATTATIASATGWPSAPFTMEVNNEVILVGARAGTSLSSLTRGYDGTTAAAHTSGDGARIVAIAADFALIWNHVHTGSGGDDTAALDIADAADVTLTSIGDDELLVWDTSAFVNKTLTEAGILGLAGGTLTGNLTFDPGWVSTDYFFIDATTVEDIFYLKAWDGTATRSVITIYGPSHGSNAGDILFGNPVDGNGSLRYDHSDTRWEFSKPVDVGNQVLSGPLDPTLGTHVGDRDYNDARYLELAAGSTQTVSDSVTLTGTSGTDDPILKLEGIGSAQEPQLLWTNALSFAAGDHWRMGLESGRDGRLSILHKDATVSEIRRIDFGRIDAAEGGDIWFYDGSGTISLQWDNSDNRWEFGKTVDMGANQLTGVTLLDVNEIQAGAQNFLDIQDEAGNHRIRITASSIGDLQFFDTAGAALQLWDESDDQWEFKKNADFEGNDLLNVGVASTGALGKYGTWSPSYGNLTVGNGTVIARYARAGNVIHAWYQLTFGSTTSIDATNPTISLPATASSSYTVSRTFLGHAYLFDTGSANYDGKVRLQSTTTVSIGVDAAGSTYVQQNNISASAPHTWATGDIISWYAIYEAA